ncbi:hypothetical protein D3C73_1377630 [compost metagenome]
MRRCVNVCRPRAKQFAFTIQAVFQRKLLRACEQAFINEADACLPRLQLIVLIQEFNLLHLRCPFPVSIDDTVAAEAVVCRPVPEVAAVGQVLPSIAVFGEK